MIAFDDFTIISHTGITCADFASIQRVPTRVPKIFTLPARQVENLGPPAVFGLGWAQRDRAGLGGRRRPNTKGAMAAARSVAVASSAGTPGEGAPGQPLMGGQPP